MKDARIMRVQSVDVAGGAQAQMPVRVWLGMAPRLQGRGVTLDGWRVVAPMTMTGAEVICRVRKDAVFVDRVRRGKIFAKDLVAYEVGTTSSPNAWPSIGIEDECTEPQRYYGGQPIMWVAALVNGTGRNHHRQWCWSIPVPGRGNPAMVQTRLGDVLWSRSEYDHVSAGIVASDAIMCPVGYIDQTPDNPICLRWEDVQHPIDLQTAAMASGLLPTEIIKFVSEGMVSDISAALGRQNTTISCDDYTRILDAALYRATQMRDDPPLQIVASVLRVTRATVYRLSAAGRLQVVRVQHGAPRDRDRIARASLVDYLIGALDALEQSMAAVELPA